MRIRQLFLVDCLGALLTAFLLACVLARYEGFFGMPRPVLLPLALTALCFSVYSLCCSLFAGRRPGPWLSVIAIANGAYCLVTIALLIVFRDRLTFFGFAYFMAEICVLIALVYVEVRKLQEIRRSRPQ